MSSKRNHSAFGASQAAILSAKMFLKSALPSVMKVLAAAGYGDYYPVSRNEMLVGILFMLVGIVFFSQIMGSFIEIIQNYDSRMGNYDKGSDLNSRCFIWVVVIMTVDFFILTFV
jgi:hypothetical protein